MQFVGWPVGGAAPCSSCVQAQMLVNVLLQGMHPVCMDACRSSAPVLPQHQQYTAHQQQVPVAIATAP